MSSVCMLSWISRLSKPTRTYSSFEIASQSTSGSSPSTTSLRRSVRLSMWMCTDATQCCTIPFTSRCRASSHRPPICTFTPIRHEPPTRPHPRRHKLHPRAAPCACVVSRRSVGAMTTRSCLHISLARGRPRGAAVEGEVPVAAPSCRDVTGPSGPGIHRRSSTTRSSCRPKFSHRIT